MYIGRVAEIIGKIANGFEGACMQCMTDNSGVVLDAIKEQIYAGQNGEGEALSPTYDNDPFFEEEGFWHHRAKDYKAWKKSITPPVGGVMLGLPPRAEEVPNLYIDGTFYGQIKIMPGNMMLVTDPGAGNGPDIVAKYGDSLLDMGPTAKEYFNRQYMLPAIERFFKDCGYV